MGNLKTGYMQAIIWLERYLQGWPSTLLVVSHDRNFLEEVPTDMLHVHTQASINSTFKVQSGASGHSLGLEDNNLGSSPGLLGQ